MKLITWKFKDGKSHIYDKNTFKKKVKQLLYRVKPNGFSLLTLYFTNNSESVYAVFISNKSSNSYMFRISSHATFSDNNFWTYNTNNYDSFKSLEQQIQQDLKDRHSNLTFTFDLQDYLFYMGTFHLQRHKKHLIIERNFFKKNRMDPNKRKVFIETKRGHIEGVITDIDYLDLVQRMIEKGYISGHPVNNVYSMIIVTSLFHSLAKHYKDLYDSQLKKIDFNLYFDILMDTKNVVAKRDLSEKSSPETNHLWAFKYQYFLGNFQTSLKEMLKISTPEDLKLLTFTFDEDKKSASMLFILKESPDIYLNLIISSKKVRLLHHYKAFRTVDFYDVSSLEDEIYNFLNTLQISMFKRLKQIDYLELKMIMSLDKKKKLLIVPSSLTHETLSNLKEIYLVEKKPHFSREVINEETEVEGLRRVLVTGFATLVPIDDNYSKVIVTESAKKLLKEIDSMDLILEEFVPDVPSKEALGIKMFNKT